MSIIQVLWAYIPLFTPSRSHRFFVPSSEIAYFTAASVLTSILSKNRTILLPVCCLELHVSPSESVYWVPASGSASVEISHNLWMSRLKNVAPWTLREQFSFSLWVHESDENVRKVRSSIIDVSWAREKSWMYCFLSWFMSRYKLGLANEEASIHCD